MNPLHNLLSSQEQKLLLGITLLIVSGSMLNLFGFIGKEEQAKPALDSLHVALEENEELLIDLRTAKLEELMCLPGIGEKRAQDILSFRLNQPFTAVNQIMLVRGIGIKTYRRILPYLVTFGDTLSLQSNTRKQINSRDSAINSTPVNINEASIEELCTLVGIGPVKAKAIVQYREEYGPFSSVEDICNVKGIGAKTLAKNLSRIKI